MQTHDYIATLAVSTQRQFANEMRALLCDEQDIDIVSFADSEELALHSAEQCAVVLLDATVYTTKELNSLTCALRMRVSTIKVIVVFEQNMPQIILSHIQCGVIGFLFSDDPATKLGEIIRGAESGKAYISAEIVAQLMQRLGELRMRHNIRSRTRPRRIFALQDIRMLSRREQEVFDLMCHGMSNRQIAEQLIITYGTVKNHVHKILKKLGVASRKDVIVLQALMAGQGQQGRQFYL